MKKSGFLEKYRKPHDGPKYNTEFWRMREHAKRGRCIVADLGYQGPGHHGCWHGAQGGYTAHHIGWADADGLVYCCGRAHDLLAGYGGTKQQKAFWQYMTLMLGVETVEEGGLWDVKQELARVAKEKLDETF